jgi:copper homeostasis protein
MSIVSTFAEPATDRGALLEVDVLHGADVAGAVEGGADRLLVVANVPLGRLSAEPSVVADVCRASQVPVRAVLRLNDGLSTTGGELTRLVGLGEEYLRVGVEGLAFGFLDSDLEVDLEVCRYLTDTLAGVPWTFSGAIDSALDTQRSWRRVRGLPGLDAVLSSGSPRGLGAGHDELTERAAADPDVARLLMAGGGLRPEHVPWLARAGVRQFHVGSSVRPGGSWTKAYVDRAHVRAWRMLLDDAVGRAQRAATPGGVG